MLRGEEMAVGIGLRIEHRGSGEQMVAITMLMVRNKNMDGKYELLLEGREDSNNALTDYLITAIDNFIDGKEQRRTTNYHTSLWRR